MKFQASSHLVWQYILETTKTGILATQLIYSRYPEATEEELQSGDNVCIICREDMLTACKKLPCNHIFHTSCLRSWFQRQQTCPTCRMEVLRMPQPRTVPPPQPPPQQPQPPFPNSKWIYCAYLVVGELIAMI